MAGVLNTIFEGIAELSASSVASGFFWGEVEMPECLKKKAEAEEDE